MKDTFQRRFIEAKEASGRSWSEIADMTGLSKPRISQYKNGKYEPSPDALYALAMALNVNPGWLMGYDIPMDPMYTGEDEQYLMDDLTQEECDLVTLYRSATPEAQSAAMLTLKANRKEQP